MIAFLSAIFLSAFLLFQIQPIIARYILPWYGGSATIWTSCMMFFQIALLLGYLYAHLLASRVPTKRQSQLHIGLLVLSLLLLPIGVPESWAPSTDGNPALEILLLLTISVGAPFVLISASGPLLQHWFAGVFPGKSPFRLYSLSNIGSLAALLTYPVLVEPRFTLGTQSVGWSSGYFVLVLLFAACGLFYARSSTVNTATNTLNEPPEKSVSMHDRVLWVALAACGSAMLLAITNQISTDVAVVPFMWVLPLSLYLITFIICFDKDAWYVRPVWIPLLLLAIGQLVYIMFFEFTDESVSFAYQLFAWSLALFAVCMVCHGELARSRSSVSNLTTFYLYVALGGAVGGVFVNLIAPQIFTGYWELHIAITGAVILSGICIGIDKSVIKTPDQRNVLATVWSLGVIVLAGLLVKQVQEGRTDSIYVDRSYFGTLYVDEYDKGRNDHERQFYHGRIQHGRQFMHPMGRNIATAYYGNATGLGMAILQHPRRLAAEPSDRTLNIGVIGLGAGVISVYGLAGDSFTYYEIDPLVEKVARDYFYFVEESKADVNVVIGDARVSMQSELEANGSNRYDILVLDAFSGDAIPVHLVTEEAFALYEKHLKADGILALHITNDYIDLKDLMRSTAERLGKEAIWVESYVESSYLNSSDWILISGNEEFNNLNTVRSEKQEWPDDEFKRLHWTDDFSNLFELIDWGT